MDLFTRELTRNPPTAILDLGSSSTETVRYLSGFCTNLSILDLFQSASSQSGARSTIFRFSDSICNTLPDGGDGFDAVLIWDLLHYFDRPTLDPFIRRLARCCKPDALVYLMASAIAPIPLTPIRFRIHDRQSLLYQMASETRAESPQLRAGDVERIMKGFRPMRLYQLRNGLQEFLFRFEGEDAAESSDDVSVAESDPPDKPLVLFE